MRTRVAEMLGVEFPVGAFSHRRGVVAAVSNAGGFGVLGAVAHDPERTGNPARMPRIAWIDGWEGADSPCSAGDALADRRDQRVPAADQSSWGSTGFDSSSTFRQFCGQVVGSVNKVQPTKAVVLDMVAEFIDAVEHLEGVVES